MKLEADVAGEAKSVEITVNHVPVIMPKRKATGLEIKQAAIDQHVAIELDFVLSRRVGAKHETIGDNDVVHLKDGEEFSAVAPDDNS